MNTLKFTFTQSNIMPLFFGGSSRPTVTNRIINATEAIQLGGSTASTSLRSVLFPSSATYPYVSIGWGGTCFDYNGSPQRYCVQEANSDTSACCSDCPHHFGMDLGFAMTCTDNPDIIRITPKCPGTCVNAPTATVSGKCGATGVSAATSAQSLILSLDKTLPCLPPNINVGAA